MKKLKLLWLALAVIPVMFSHAGTVKSIKNEKDTQLADGLYEEALVLCQGHKEFTIRRKKNEKYSQWCGIDVEGFCSKSKVSAAIKVCHSKYSRKIENQAQAAENRTHPKPEPEVGLKKEESPKEGSSNVESPKEEIKVGNSSAIEEQAAQQNTSVTQPVKEELPAAETNEPAQSEKESLEMAERHLEIERQRLEIRKQELELQRQAFELQQKMSAEDAKPKTQQAEKVSKKDVTTEDKTTVPVLFRGSMAQ